MIEESVNLLSLMRYGNMFSYDEMKNALIERNLLSENEKGGLKFKIIISLLEKEKLIDKRHVDGRYCITPKGRGLLEKLRG